MRRSEFQRIILVMYTINQIVYLKTPILLMNGTKLPLEIVLHIQMHTRNKEKTVTSIIVLKLEIKIKIT